MSHGVGLETDVGSQLDRLAPEFSHEMSHVHVRVVGGRGGLPEPTARTASPAPPTAWPAGPRPGKLGPWQYPPSAFTTSFSNS